jgi:HEAT repeat protein
MTVRTLAAVAMLAGAAGGLDLRAGQEPGGSLAAELASPDPRVRGRALRQIERSGLRDAVEAVAALARDPEDGIQLEAIRATLHLLVEPRPRPQSTVSAAQTAFDAELAPAAAVPPPVFSHLAFAMGDLHPEVRRDAALALAVLAGPGARGLPDEETMAAAERALVVMLGAPEPGVRVAAARAAGRLYRVPLPGTGVAGTRRAPAAVGDALIALLNQRVELERLVAMEALGLIGEVRAVTALTERHAHHRRAGPPIEMAATLDVLARLGHPSSVPFFLEALSDRWDAMRQAGYEGLARVAVPDEVAPILTGRAAERAPNVALAQAFARERLLADGSLARIVEAVGVARTRTQARGYLLELGPPVTRAVVAGLSRPDAMLRATLADVLGRIGTPEATDALRPLVTERQRVVADEASLAIRRIEAGLSLGAPAPR